MKKIFALLICSLSILPLSACSSFFDFFKSESKPSESKEPKIEEIILTEESATMNAGGEYQLKFTTAPDSVDASYLHFKTENIGVASVNNEGLIKAKGNGTTNIIISSIYNENVYATFSITSKGVSLTNFKLTTRLIHINVGEEKQIEKIVYPNNASNKDAIYTSSDEGVASVDENGLVYAEGVGEAIITAVSQDKGIVDTCNVVVVDDGELTKTELKYTMKDFTTNQAYPIADGSPTTGNINLIVLPIFFSDSNEFIADKDQVREDIEASYFGTNEDTGWRSVKTFYEEESFGGIKVNGVVADWFDCGESYTKYGTADNMETFMLVSRALDAFKESHKDIDWNLYDQDNNGHIDDVCVVYGSPSADALKRSDLSNLCNYQSTIGYDPVVGSPTLIAFTWVTYARMYPSKSIAQEHTGKSSYAEGEGDYTLDVHGYAHELGHMFGLVDYYDYASKSKPVGGFSLQCSSAFMHDPFSLLALGWAQPYIPESSCEIRLNNFVDSGDCILLTPSFNDENSPFDEYFLINVFSPTKLNEHDAIFGYWNSGDFTADDYGVQIWHVDARLAKGSDTLGFSINNLTTVPSNDSNGGVRFAFTNSSKTAESYWISPLGVNYSDYDILYLVRNYPDLSYSANYLFNGSDLFREGDTFSMDQFSTQFVNGNKLDNGKSLGWELEVTSLDREGATISLTKI